MFNKFLPLIFILMKDKSNNSYVEVFKILKTTFEIELRFVVTDFEIAISSSIITATPNSRVFGCDFHFGQCIWRKIQSFGMAEQYCNNDEVRYICRMFLNLSYFMKSRKDEAYKFIISTIKKYNKISEFKEFKEYFEKMFFGKNDKNAIFDFGFWSVSERILMDFPRTTNSIEAWHRGFNDLVRVAHPNLGRFINSLQIETEKIRIKIAQSKVRKFDVCNKDFKREKELKIIIQNEKFIDVKNLFECLNKINGWKFQLLKNDLFFYFGEKPVYFY
jgi:hypothetical protein